MKLSLKIFQYVPQLLCETHLFADTPWAEKMTTKKAKTAKFHKILFWAQTEGPRGSSLKCKSDRREISCGILVLKVFVRSIWTVEGQKIVPFLF